MIVDAVATTSITTTGSSARVCMMVGGCDGDAILSFQQHPVSKFMCN